MFNRLWVTFKFLLSATLIAAMFAILIAVPRAGAEPTIIGILAALLFFAALPWVNFATPNRSLGLTGIGFSLVSAFFAARTAMGLEMLPRICTGRRILFCEFGNLLFSAGGELLAASPLAVFAALIFAGSIRILFSEDRHRKS